MKGLVDVRLRDSFIEYAHECVFRCGILKAWWEDSEAANFPSNWVIEAPKLASTHVHTICDLNMGDEVRLKASPPIEL